MTVIYKLTYSVSEMDVPSKEFRRMLVMLHSLKSLLLERRESKARMGLRGNEKGYLKNKEMKRHGEGRGGGVGRVERGGEKERERERERKREREKERERERQTEGGRERYVGVDD